ncbi:hypothetical protein N7466_006560 [Penicillium verhagenii]|uniref:uncharacterized protein n=1 Tax=Penicillium verhagenii TaxID=1562060 RepID=UPI00254593EB|nr:uncharacterized protein N7466_006560 [Penicillium verhagenii]KAJ5931067.1 hypothetical protein N7466_006560 [Penicillium verhagenii]
MVRTAEGPMDFEWQTRPPMDLTSPFSHLENKKRTHSTFNSPDKKPPSLRPPNSQPFLFSRNDPAPSSKSVFGLPAFTTPRKVDIDFSSEQNTNKERRGSILGMYGRFGGSPGRGEIPRLKQKAYSNAALNKVHKKRRRNQELSRQVKMESEDESDRGSGDQRISKTAKGNDSLQVAPSRMSSFSEFFALLEAHPNVPSILSWWAQLLVNLSLFTLAVYIVFTFVAAIRAEFEHAAEEVSDTILADMARCAKDYVDNKCGGGDRLPALESVCENWERCMNRDPAKVGRAKVSAHTMALIINNFIDPISWKAVTIFLATISTVTVVSNWSFRSFRSRQSHQPDFSHNQHNYPRQPPAHDPYMHSQPLHLQHPPTFGYYGQPDPRQNHSYTQNQDSSLMLENTKPMDFVTERSRDRENHLRTPSPSKRRFT